jgi:hypothetical protein
MNALQTPSDALIADAAALRAAGQSWEAIGEVVDRHADTVRRWPDRYPDRWIPTYRAVESQLTADAANEARAILRMMLRDKRGKLRLGAAAQLLKWRIHTCEKEIVSATGELSYRDKKDLQLLEQMRQMSDEELERYINRCMRDKNMLPASNGEVAAEPAEPDDERTTHPPSDDAGSVRMI